jgi:AraC-like DNA-binding protein
VRGHLLTLHPTDWPDFDLLAKSMGVSSANLRRRLRADGQSFQLIKDELRLAIAQKMLAKGNISVTDISEALGYSEPSAFFRAYKKWTGRSPKACARSNA